MVVIKVEELSKEYIINHNNKQQRYTALRDVMSSWAKDLVYKITRPLERTNESSLQYENFRALKDINFEIHQGERVGIIGRNGAGKSTLLKVLSRITEPTSGKISIKGRVASLLEVGTGFHPELTGRENIFLNGAILGMSRAHVKEKFDEIVFFADVERFLDTPVKRYSSGMYVRLAFAVAAHLDPEILIVDEVLAVGDAQFQKKCLGKMEEVGKQGRTVIFVSHNMSLTKGLCNKGILLNAGEVFYEGNMDETVRQYEKIISNTLPDKTYPLGILYQNSLIKFDGFSITQVSMTDKKGKPISVIKTFDDLNIEIKFYSPREQKNAAFDFYICSLSGLTLIRFASNPDCGYDINFKRGENLVSFTINSLPLPAGKYVIMLGLTIPMKEWLLPKNEYCTLEVDVNDIYETGFPQTDTYCTIAVNGEWQVK
jgi:lipopolysaccharide transport system ATP-binding protein